MIIWRCSSLRARAVSVNVLGSSIRERKKTRFGRRIATDCTSLAIRIRKCSSQKDIKLSLNQAGGSRRWRSAMVMEASPRVTVVFMVRVWGNV